MDLLTYVRIIQMFTVLLPTLTSISMAQLNPLLPKRCTAEKYGTIGCDNNGGNKIRLWYFNDTVQSCLSYSSSCSRNGDNSFDTLSQCQQTCNPYPLGYCIGGGTPAEELCFVSWIGSFTECPLGYKCKPTEHVGVCCPIITETYYDAAFSGECNDRREAEKVDGSLGTKVTLVGSSCSELLCSDGFECVQVNPLFAKCCKRADEVDPCEPNLCPRGTVCIPDPVGFGFGSYTCGPPREVPRCRDVDMEWRYCGSGCVGGCGRGIPVECPSECVSGCFCRFPLVLRDPDDPSRGCTHPHNCAVHERSCSLQRPSIRFSCDRRAHFSVFYFDSQRKQCRKYSKGHCIGNPQLYFSSKEQCANNCENK